MPIGPTLEVQEDLQVILTGVEDNTQEILDGDKGDITVSSAGTVWSIDNNAVVEAKINTGAVTETKIADSAVTENKIANNAVTVNKIANDTVTNSKLANMATATVKGRATAGTGDPEDLAIDNDLSTVSASDDTIPSAKAVKAYVDLLELKTRIRNAGLINGFIRVTVASNNLTVAVSTSPTSQVDPTATNPVYVFIDGVLRSITGALSLTRNAGTNWFNSGATQHAGNQMSYFVYCGYNATDGVTLGFARFSYARLYSNFNTTNTNIRHCAISTTTNAAAGDNYVVVGRFEATLSATPNFDWSVPTFDNQTLIQEPIYNTRWAKYSPRVGTVLDAGSKNYGTIVNDNCRFMFDGQVCHVIFDLNGTTASPAANRVAIEAPFKARSIGYAGGSWIGFVAAAETTGVISGRNASAGTSGWFYMVRYDLANLADGTVSIFRGTITYEMEP